MTTKIQQVPKQKRNRPGEVTLLVWNVPAIVRNRFKIRCLRAGTSMRAAILAFMKDGEIVATDKES
jgi:hypothetical protein